VREIMLIWSAEQIPGEITQDSTSATTGADAEGQPGSDESAPTGDEDETGE
jgi:hypothetical protein